jgi:hypothetical protein
LSTFYAAVVLLVCDPDVSTNHKNPGLLVFSRE